jgi:hypothetical protein
MVLTAVVAASPASAHGHEHGPDHGAGLIPPGDWTHDQVLHLLDLIERTEAALPAYDLSPSELESLGFHDFGVTAPGGYDHWINPGWINDEHLVNPEYPESLVFRNTPGGGYELVAAMFFLTSQHDMSNIPPDLAWLPGWHVHPELCVDGQGRFTGLVGSDGQCSDGSPSDGPPMMHVWIVDNDCGHRFGGIGVGGLHCDVGHGPGHGPGPGPGPEPGHGPGHEPGHVDPESGDPAGRQPPTASAAQPVRAQPTFTG